MRLVRGIWAVRTGAEPPGWDNVGIASIGGEIERVRKACSTNLIQDSVMKKGSVELARGVPATRRRDTQYRRAASAHRHLELQRVLRGNRVRRFQPMSLTRLVIGIKDVIDFYGQTPADLKR